MSTRAVMLAEMASMLKRTNLGTENAEAISHAIRTIMASDDRLYWLDTRDKTFTTVADQIWYSPSDDADIGLMATLDSVQIRLSSRDYPMDKYTDIAYFEYLQDGNVSSTQSPYAYHWRNSEIGIYPPPAGAYVITMYGRYDLAEPASDSETSNVWMTLGEGYEPVMHKAMSYVHRFHTRDTQQAMLHENEYREKMGDLLAKSNRMKAAGYTKPMDF